MPYNPVIHHRRSHRLKDYDYTSPGWYLLTLCTHQRQHLFGKICNGRMVLNEMGMIAQAHWQRLPQHFAAIALDVFVVMPDHFHGIIAILDTPPTPDFDKTYRPQPIPGRGKAFCESPIQLPGDSNQNASLQRSVADRPIHPKGPPSGSIGAIVGNFKSVSTRQINRLRKAKGTPVWQRDYYDHIIRDEAALTRIRAYVMSNPQRGNKDRFPELNYSSSNTLAKKSIVSFNAAIKISISSWVL